MNHVELIKSSLAEIFRVESEDGFARVTTHCLYPTNGFVNVVVRFGENTFLASDEGNAVREIQSAGASIENPDKMLSDLVRQMGLSIKGGVIRSPECTSRDLAFAIVSVANASRTAADWLFSNARIRPHHNFKEVVANFLKATYSDVSTEIIVGSSNKPHKFENVLKLPNGKKLIVDAVVPDSSSINAKVVANLDVRSANHPDIEQRILYDDADNWSIADLNLLAVGAPVVRFSQAPSVLGRLTA